MHDSDFVSADYQYNKLSIITPHNLMELFLPAWLFPKIKIERRIHFILTMRYVVKSTGNEDDLNSATLPGWYMKYLNV